MQNIKRFEYDLEGLRGFAAILVIWCHAIGMPGCLDPGYNPVNVLGYQPPAHFCVLIFFVLSGYVIGSSTKTRLLPSTVGTYLQKRLLRIYPIYFISMVLALVVAVQFYPLRTILGNFTFLQILSTPVIEENNVSWSLQYEISYYLLFIPLSLLAVKPLGAVVGCLLVGAGVFHFLPQHALPASYAFGFAFWCCGWALSRYAPKLQQLPVSYTLLLSTLLLFLSLRLNPIYSAVSKTLQVVIGTSLGYPEGFSFYETAIGPTDFVFLVYAIVGILIFIHRDFPGRRVLLPLLFLLPSLGFLQMAYKWNSTPRGLFVVPTLSYLLALVFFFGKPAVAERAGKWAMGWLIKAGSISYGLYIIHFPILSFFQRISYFSGSALTYWVRFALFMPLAFLAAYVLERVIQPRVKQLMTPASARPAASLEKESSNVSQPTNSTVLQPTDSLLKPTLR